MLRKSKRELKRSLDQLQGGDPDGPSEIVITHRIVETGHPAEVGEPVQRTRVWRDELGEWHTEEIDTGGEER